MCVSVLIEAPYPLRMAGSCAELELAISAGRAPSSGADVAAMNKLYNIWEKRRKLFTSYRGSVFTRSTITTSAAEGSNRGLKVAIGAGKGRRKSVAHAISCISDADFRKSTTTLSKMRTRYAHSTNECLPSADVHADIAQQTHSAVGQARFMRAVHFVGTVGGTTVEPSHFVFCIESHDLETALELYSREYGVSARFSVAQVDQIDMDDLGSILQKHVVYPRQAYLCVPADTGRLREDAVAAMAAAKTASGGMPPRWLRVSDVLRLIDQSAPSSARQHGALREALTGSHGGIACLCRKPHIMGLPCVHVMCVVREAPSGWFAPLWRTSTCPPGLREEARRDDAPLLHGSMSRRRAATARFHHVAERINTLEKTKASLDNAHKTMATCAAASASVPVDDVHMQMLSAFSTVADAMASAIRAMLPGDQEQRYVGTPVDVNVCVCIHVRAVSA